ncbi:MAG: hypothetical protein HY905_04785 [Deltaproteobacteria bacterium]|nr:hypothetical protein [Deltaproteobacteria bacterium]
MQTKSARVVGAILAAGGVAGLCWLLSGMRGEAEPAASEEAPPLSAVRHDRRSAEGASRESRESPPVTASAVVSGDDSGTQEAERRAVLQPVAPVAPSRTSPGSGSACDDADPCTVFDHDVDGACVGRRIKCDDGNEFTRDQCNNDGCIHEFLPGAFERAEEQGQ